MELAGTATASGRAVANAVVWLDAAGRVSRAPKAVLHQRSLKFAPQVLAVRTGTVVDFPKSAPAVREVGMHAYVAARYPLSIAGETIDGQLVLLQDWQPTRQSLREVRVQVALGGIAIFAVALAAALVFSGRVTRALADISRAASETAAGDWTRLVPVRGSAEVRNLAHAVNGMAINLHRHHAEVEAQRLRVFRATMTTVHDLVNNFLANMQLIRLEAEDVLPQETLDLFDQLIEDNAAELRLLGALQVVREKDMGVGTGIDYRAAADAPGDAAQAGVSGLESHT